MPTCKNYAVLNKVPVPIAKWPMPTNPFPSNTPTPAQTGPPATAMHAATLGRNQTCAFHGDTGPKKKNKPNRTKLRTH